MKSQAIWHPHAQPSTPLMLFRQRLILDEKPTAGRMLIGASGPFSVYVNGRLVTRGSGQLAQKMVGLSIDLSEGWIAGENTVIIAVLGSGESDWLRADCYLNMGAAAQREFHTGTPWEVWCDEAWLSGTPCAFIAARAKSEWMRGHIGEENWQPVGVVMGPLLPEWEPLAVEEREAVARSVTNFGEMEAEAELDFASFDQPMRNVKFVHREALLDVGKTEALVQTRSADRAAYITLDFGRVVYGHPRVRVRGREGAVIDLGFARESSAVDVSMRYVCSGTKSDWTAPQAVACRYVLVRVWACPEEMEVDCISLMEQSFAPLVENELEAAELVDLWEIGLSSITEARREVYLDTVGGGRGTWLHHYVLGLNDFYRTANARTLKAALQSAVLPTAPDESAFFALCVAAYYRFTADAALALDRLPMAVKGLERIALSDCDTATCALYAGAYDHMAAAYAACDEADRAAQCEAEAQHGRRAVQARWSAERGALRDGATGGLTSQWAHALALYFDLLDSEQVRAIDGALADADHRLDDLWQAFFLVGGLWRCGLEEAARASIHAHWGRLLSRTGRSWRDRAGTLHIVPGVDALLAEHALGVGCLVGPDRAVEVRPQIAPMQRVSGRVCVGEAMLSVEWSLNGAGYFSLVAESEREGPLHLAIPRLDKRFPTVTLNGETVWRNEKIYPNFHVHEVISEEHAVVLVVHKAGRYHAELSA